MCAQNYYIQRRAEVVSGCVKVYTINNITGCPHGRTVMEDKDYND